MTESHPAAASSPHSTGPAQDPFADQESLLAALPTAELHKRMGIEIIEARPERVVGRMPVQGNTQPHGLLHGGASCVLAEALGSYGAAMHGRPDRIAVGVDINATHHRSVRDGIVTGVATPAHRGRQSASYEVVISDDEGRRVCTARLTCLLQPPNGTNAGQGSA